MLPAPWRNTTDVATFVTQVTKARTISGAHPRWAGIGAYRLPQGQIVEDVQAARRLGVGGAILFSYDSLTARPAGPEFFSDVGRAPFSTQ
jgi:hypothetical protein